MDGGVLRFVVIAALLGGVGMWVLSSLLFRVVGTWERETTLGEHVAGPPERIILGQLGPFVTGRRDVPGGHQEFSGLLLFRTLRLTRRDHGVRHLVSMGFPDAIAAKVAGQVMARLELRLDGENLAGDFIASKIEFTHQPPRVTGSRFLPPQPRRYRRVDTLETVPALDELGVSG